MSSVWFKKNKIKIKDFTATIYMKGKTFEERVPIKHYERQSSKGPVTLRLHF